MSEIFSKDESEGYSLISAHLSLSLSPSFKILEISSMFQRQRGRERERERERRVKVIYVPRCVMWSVTSHFLPGLSNWKTSVNSLQACICWGNYKVTASNPLPHTQTHKCSQIWVNMGIWLCRLSDSVKPETQISRFIRSAANKTLMTFKCSIVGSADYHEKVWLIILIII